MDRDSIYARLVAAAGLYGQAFFGHRATLAQRRILDKLWQVAIAVSANSAGLAR